MVCREESSQAMNSVKVDFDREIDDQMSHVQLLSPDLYLLSVHHIIYRFFFVFKQAQRKS